MKASNEDTLELFAPDLNQGPEDPGPTTGELSCLGKAGKLRLARWGYEKFEGFWPKKHTGVKSGFRVPPRFCGNQADLPNHVFSAIGVQRMKSFGAGVRGPHRPLLRRNPLQHGCYHFKR